MDHSTRFIPRKDISILCKKAKLQAGMKLTTLCSAFDKENLIEFPLDLLHYIYNYYVAMLLYLLWSPCYLSNDSFVIYRDCDLWLSIVMWPFCDLCHTFCDSVIVMWYFPILYPSSKEKKRKRKEILNNNLAVLPSYDISCIVSLKEKKRNINNDLAILPSHDRIRL